MKSPDHIVNWLLQGDISIQYQVHRDLFDDERKELQNRIESEGWGKAFLDKRLANGHWGQKFYQPKWTSTHYTLLDLRNLNIRKNHPAIQETVNMVIETEKNADGGIFPITNAHISEICINGMFLNYASYLKAEESKLKSIVDFILSEHMKDGGFNCRSNRDGAKHSSMHTTISVLEGLAEFVKNGHTYRLTEVTDAIESAHEFLLMHHLYLSDRTGEVIRKDFLRLTYPDRWHFNILRALDHFQYVGAKADERMKPALDMLKKKSNKNGTWNVQSPYPGEVHFTMEKAGQPSRWNTLRALRVLQTYDGTEY